MHIFVYTYMHMGKFITTVKLDNELYTQFREVNVREKISFQDFVNKCLEKYLTDTKFRSEISESISQKLSYNKPFSLSSEIK